MFDPAWKLGLGFLTGVLFGFLLQKGRVAKYEVIVGQFLLRDFTVVKIMGTAVVVGMLGVYALVEWELASLHVKPLLIGGVVFGGVLFGLGMVLLGYCPGTSVAACGEGRRDAMVGVLGMLVGAALFVVGFGAIKPFQTAGGDYGEQTLPQATQTSPWLWVAAALILFVVALITANSRARLQQRGHRPVLGREQRPLAR